MVLKHLPEASSRTYHEQANDNVIPRWIIHGFNVVEAATTLRRLYFSGGQWQPLARLAALTSRRL